MLRFNGRSAAENQGDYLEIGVSDTHWYANDFSTEIAQLTKFKPDIVVYDSARVLASILEPLEANHRPGAEPRYVGIAETLSQSLKTALAARPGLAARFYELDVVHNSNLDRLENHLRDWYPESNIDYNNGATTYDALYTIVYAAYAAQRGRESLDGTTIASGIARLVDGPTVDVGRDGIFEAFRVLRAGGGIDLRGAATDLAFDPSTGDTSYDQDIVCVVPRDGSVDEVPSGLRFNGLTGKLEGTYQCP
jgi:ABC-type branched-subunit amino acid transport system substrate-binding protein